MFCVAIVVGVGDNSVRVSVAGVAVVVDGCIVGCVVTDYGCVVWSVAIVAVCSAAVYGGVVIDATVWYHWCCRC